ncbi:MAG: SDR family NAD(P)-dependent oxidoreductase [Myxococcales bacterium]|nr:SDR family NAD(P)-dependent oxidoreductase [Myxococcales bacterium]
MQELTGRVAVVTGAASGIGRALAQRLGEEGMKLVLADVEEAALAQASNRFAQGGLEVLAVRTDVAKAEAVQTLADRAFDRFGAVHVLCNNAGVGSSGGVPLWKHSLKEWEWVLGVNLWGVIHGIRAFVPRMIEQGTPGHIVNTASVAGLLDGGGIYGVTKHGVVSLTGSLYRQLAAAQSELGVSVLCPGLVDTNIWDAARNRPEHLAPDGPLSERAAARAAQQHDQMRAMLASGYDPAEVASAVVDGMRARRFYIVPAQPAIKQEVKRRMQRIVDEENPPTSQTQGRSS